MSSMSKCPTLLSVSAGVGTPSLGSTAGGGSLTGIEDGVGEPTDEEGTRVGGKVGAGRSTLAEG